MTINVCLVTGVSAGESQEPNREWLEKTLNYDGNAWHLATRMRPEGAELGTSYNFKVHLFDPTRYMSTSWIQRVMNKWEWTNRAYDVLALMFGRRDEVLSHYLGFTEKYKPDIIIAHSLGCVVTGISINGKARELGRAHMNATHIMLSNPLWIPGYATLMDHDFWDWVYLGTNDIFSTWSTKDVIAELPLPEAEFHGLTAQRQTGTSHSFRETFNAACTWLEGLYLDG